MVLVGREELSRFVSQHRDAEKWIENWVADVQYSNWLTPQDIKNRYASTSFLSGNRVIFNVKGNHYRLEVQIAFKTEKVAVKWIGTHAEYTKRNRQGD